ncbi:MAG: YihY/virulence factor BrkB family protein [Candidatus Latescibacterota bacterium]
MGTNGTVSTNGNSRGLLGLLLRTYDEFTGDDCPKLAAALAYYTILALPPLLALIVTFAGLFIGPERIAAEIQKQMGNLLGPGAAGQIKTMIEHATRPGSEGLVGTIISFGILLFGATGAFAQLQDALNRAWGVEPDPRLGTVKTFAVKRTLSFGIILIWVFYASLLLLVGAEFTQVWACSRGKRIWPDRRAVRVVREKRYVRNGDPASREETGPHRS